MIGSLLETITNELNVFIGSKTSSAPTPFAHLLRPVSNDGSEYFSEGDGVYLSLLNIEEELILREGGVKRHVVANELSSAQPPVNINLQIIFIAHCQNDYTNELNFIYWVMEFFQIKSLFNAVNTPALAEAGFTDDDKLIVELNTLPLRELHYIWGNLGMKQTPSITYRIKMLTIQNSAVLSEGGVISSITLSQSQKE